MGSVSLAVLMPYLVHSMPWSGEHSAFIVEDFIQNGNSPRNISAFRFQAESTNKISIAGLTVTLGNFTNGHSTAPRLLCGEPNYLAWFNFY
jgi:hypothetical protein